MKQLFTVEHLAKLIDACLEDVDEGGSKLFDLSQLFHCLGDATGDPLYDAFVPILGSFGSEIISFRPLVFLPILPEPTRKKFQTTFNDAINGCKEALLILKTQLCKNDSVDFKEILRSLSILGKHDYNLTMSRSTLTRPSSTGPEE